MTDIANSFCKHHSGFDARIKKVEDSTKCHANKVEKKTFWTVILIIIPLILGAYGYSTGINMASSGRRDEGREVESSLKYQLHQLERREDLTSERYKQVDKKLDQIIEMQKKALEGVQKNKDDINSLKWYHKDN